MCVPFCTRLFHWIGQYANETGIMLSHMATVEPMYNGPVYSGHPVYNGH